MLCVRFRSGSGLSSANKLNKKLASCSAMANTFSPLYRSDFVVDASMNQHARLNSERCLPLLRWQLKRYTANVTWFKDSTEILVNGPYQYCPPHVQLD
jgi:hypothetical protein